MIYFHTSYKNVYNYGEFLSGLVWVFFIIIIFIFLRWGRHGGWRVLCQIHWWCCVTCVWPLQHYLFKFNFSDQILHSKTESNAASCTDSYKTRALRYNRREADITCYVAKIRHNEGTDSAQKKKGLSPENNAKGSIAVV